MLLILTTILGIFKLRLILQGISFIISVSHQDHVGHITLSVVAPPLMTLFDDYLFEICFSL